MRRSDKISRSLGRRNPLLFHLKQGGAESERYEPPTLIKGMFLRKVEAFHRIQEEKGGEAFYTASAGKKHAYFFISGRRGIGISKRGGERGKGEKNISHSSVEEEGGGSSYMGGGEEKQIRAGELLSAPSIATKDRRHPGLRKGGKPTRLKGKKGGGGTIGSSTCPREPSLERGDQASTSRREKGVGLPLVEKKGSSTTFIGGGAICVRKGRGKKEKMSLCLPRLARAGAHLSQQRKDVRLTSHEERREREESIHFPSSCGGKGRHFDCREGERNRLTRKKRERGVLVVARKGPLSTI